MKSFRALGREIGATRPDIKKYLQDKGIVMRKRRTKPAVSKQQAIAQKQRLTAMITEIFPAKREVVVVMNDETYLTLDGNDWQGTGYLTSPTKEVSS